MHQTPASSDKRRIICAVVLLVLAAVIVWFVSRPEVTPFHAIAYPCLPMDTVTTDPAEFIMVSGNQSPPMQHTLPDGRVVYPVFFHGNPKVVPLVSGKVLFFPARFFDRDEVETPPLPPNNQPLPKLHRYAIVRYLPDDVKTQLKTAIQGAPP